MTGADQRVAIRRKKDLRYQARGSGPLQFFRYTSKPRFYPSRNKAILVIRTDWGCDLADFEIVPAKEVEL